MNNPSKQIAVFWRAMAERISSLLKNPLKNGQPISASVPSRNVQYVTGIFVRKPPIFQMFCSWCMAWITAPAPRKSSALKNACVKRWNIAASLAEQPTAQIM